MILFIRPPKIVDTQVLSLIFDQIFSPADNTTTEAPPSDDSTEPHEDFIILKGYDDVTIKCHKKILSRSSEVFNMLFSHQAASFVENRKNLVKIDDLDGETIRDIVRFIYFGQVHTYVILYEFRVFAKFI